MKASTYLIAAICGLLFSCKKDQIETRQPVTTSEILKGHISLFDDEDNLLTGQGSVKVSVENADPMVTVTANDKGEFELPKLKTTGTVALVYSKDGFGVYKQYFNQAQLDSVEKGIISLGASMKKISPVVVNSLTGKVVGDTLEVTCNVSFSADKNQKFIRFFRQSNDPNVSPDLISSLIRDVSGALKVKNGDNHFKFSISEVKECSKYLSGDIVYMKAFGDVSFLYLYTDVPSQKLVFPATNRNGKDDVISFRIR